MQVSKWGNSLAVRLPAAVVKKLDLKEGDKVELRPLDGGDLAVVKQSEREAALARLRTYRGMLPADFRFDREEAHER